MNGTEQRKHRTAMATVEANMIEALEALTERLEALELDEATDVKAIMAAIGDERTDRLKLADEQRTYVDRGDKNTDAKVDRFIARGFWSRLNWILFGR